MTEQRFRQEVARAETMLRFGTPTEQSYWEGYLRGVRRAYHGETFGSSDEHAAILRETVDIVRESRRRGYFDALAIDKRTEAATLLGRKGGAAGKGSPARKAAAQAAIRIRWDRAKAADRAALDQPAEIS